MRVYGDTTYQIRASKPAAGGASALEAPAEQLAAQSFLTLDYPSWAVTRDFDMGVKQARKTIQIIPETPLQLQGIAQAPIRILPKKPLRLTSVSAPGAGNSTDPEIQGEPGIRIEQGDPEAAPEIHTNPVGLKTTPKKQ
ncbi:MAG: hypothetical protein O2910_03115 [Proteobacteria bacterium]|nr:hypothetical protein [Pseudomonadota bacterium]